MLTIEALKAYGADTRAGLARCVNDEGFYLGLVEMLMNDSRFGALYMAVETLDVEKALHVACALSDTASSLALSPLVEQIEKLILCLRVKGDSEVLEKQMRIIGVGLEQLRSIDV